MNTHDGLQIRDRLISHGALRRDWLCGTCGSRLVTKWMNGGWATVCANNAAHPADVFLTKSAWQRWRSEQLAEEAIAQDILAHLPPEVRAAIDKER